MRFYAIKDNDNGGKRMEFFQSRVDRDDFIDGNDGWRKPTRSEARHYAYMKRRKKQEWWDDI